ncbi:MAG TPA: hypothetical protein DEP53_20560 [Bacteroidetes bacterium]|nr:hypothetical protein [Bacteroidota bacterium]
MKTALVLVLLVLAVPALGQAFKGDIAGKVLDSKTLEPIPSVNVVVRQKPGIGGATDVNGNFRIRGLEVGTYSLEISAVGYSLQVVTNVVVSTGRAVSLTVKLDETAIEMQGVMVQANYFSRGQQMSPISSNSFDRSEVLRSPGGVQDVQRVAQNLPGVASSTDNINELIVRGGAPFENLTILDNMEIPSINHYSNQFNSAGPINMVNADMVEDVQFSSGGFPAQYGDKTSSVMSVTVREGDRTKPIASKTAFNMAGIGTLIEGGFAAGRGSYIVSARNSLLEFLDRIVGVSALSLTAIPKYWDTQAKVVYDLSPTHKLSLNVLYGDSRINLAGDPKETDDLRKNMIDSSSVGSLYPVTRQYTAGMNLRSLLGRNGYSILTLYTSGTTTDIDVREEFAVRQRGSKGEVLSSNIINTGNSYSNHAAESFAGLKYDLFYRLHPRHEVSVGAQISTATLWRNDVYVAPDSTRYDLDRDGLYETGPVVDPGWIYHDRQGFGDVSKYYFYASDRMEVTPRFSLMLGLRYDHFTYSGQGSFSPRMSLKYQIVPALTSVTFSLGRYYQTHPFPFYGDGRQIGYNKNLANMLADHYVLGFEHILDRGLKLSIEGYYKKYRQLAVSEDFIYSSLATFWSDRYRPIGERTSYGLEFFLEQKQVEDYFGTLSISLSRSRETDPRIPRIRTDYSSEYDYPVILTALAGKVVQGVRRWLNRAPFYIRYPSYALPLSDEMEISFKYRYQSGRPYTPMEYVTWKQSREGGVKWSRGAWVTTGDQNGARYPGYTRLDLQWLSRFYLNRWNINLYVALMNVFNSKNVYYESHRSDGTVETVYQFTFFPVVGAEVEF